MGLFESNSEKNKEKKRKSKYSKKYFGKYKEQIYIEKNNYEFR